MANLFTIPLERGQLELNILSEVVKVARVTNKIADQLARHSSSHPLTGPQPASWHICECCQGHDQGLEEQET